jgi:DNA transposition AAA+ family ATPase
MSTRALNVVRKSLRAYADRGIFRGFAEAQRKHGHTGFHFVWLGNRRLELRLDTEE